MCPRCEMPALSNCKSRHGCPMPDIYANKPKPDQTNLGAMKLYEFIDELKALVHKHMGHLTEQPTLEVGETKESVCKPYERGDTEYVTARTPIKINFKLVAERVTNYERLVEKRRKFWG